MPKYSIVMPCLFNKEEKRNIVIQTMESANNNIKCDFEFIVIDDGSTLPTGFLKEEVNTYIRHDEPMGIAPSWNDGKNVARGEYIAIINDDVKMPYNWLEIMAGGFDNESVGVVGINAAGPTVEPQKLDQPYTLDHKWFSGYCFMLKRDRFLEDFDERFVPFNFEDIDYWERIQKKGYNMCKAPLNIWHKEGATIHSMRYEEQDNINLQKFIEKWGFNPKNKYFG